MKWFKFSQRIGKTPIKNIIQVESIDNDLKNKLWNVIIDIFRLEDNSGYNRNLLSNHIWASYFNETKDMMPNGGYYTYIRNWFFTQAQWHETYDFIEYLCLLHSNYYRLPSDIQYKIETRVNLIEIFNNILEQELSGYRIIENQVVPITSDIEIVAINEALKEIEKNFTIHTALKDAFNKIYGYTSDSSGIRHSLTEKDNVVSQEDAIFMLVTCSAFINYLKSKIK